MSEQFQKRYYLIIISSILGPLTTNSLVPIFEQLRINFGISSIALIALAISFYIFPFAIFQLFAGTFSDIIDKKKVVFFGYLIFLIGLIITLVAVMVKIFYLFLFAFLILGIGFSFINPTILAILNVITPEKKKGLMMGLYNASAGVGVSLGAFLSGYLANNLANGWSIIFILNPIIAFVALISLEFALRKCAPIVCKSQIIESNQGTSLINSNSKLKATFQQLKNGLNNKILLLGLIGFFAFFCVITLTNTLNEQIRYSIPDLNEQEIIFYVSIILTVNGLISVIFSPITGLLLRRFNPYFLLAIGFILMLTVIILPLGKGFMDFMIISFLIYLGSAFVWPALFKVSMDIDLEKSGTNSAIINSLRFIGYAMVGPLYLIFGIPAIYYWVFIFNIFAILIILIVSRIRK